MLRVAQEVEDRPEMLRVTWASIRCCSAVGLREESCVRLSEPATCQDMVACIYPQRSDNSHNLMHPKKVPETLLD